MEIPGKGLGVVAREAIPTGALIWTLADGYHRIMNESEFYQRLNSLSREEQRHLLIHGYGWGDKVIEVWDGAEYVNHSAQNNMCANDDPFSCYAARDISPGEELCDDYRTYDVPEYLARLCAEWGILTSREITEQYV